MRVATILVALLLPSFPLAVAEEADLTFSPLSYREHDPDQPPIDQAVESLRYLIRIEEDDWIASRLLDHLARVDVDNLWPLFRDALRSRSVNVARVAICWYGEHPDPSVLPDLEDAWVAQPRSWVRVDLIGSLAKNGSKTHTDDFIALADSGEPAMAKAAIHALATLGDPRAIPTLTRVARRGRYRGGLDALEALTTWPDSAEALGAALDLSGASDPVVRKSAVEALSSFSDPSAAARLLEVARARDDTESRAKAIEGLERLSHPGLVPTLTEILYEPASEKDSWLQTKAILALFNLDDPSAVPDLYGLDPELGGSGMTNIGGLIEYLSRDRSTKPRSFIGPSDCTWHSPVDPDDPETRRVVPPASRRSIRCFEAPGTEGDPSTFHRLPGSDAVRILDYFERDDEVWVRATNTGGATCWLPEPLLSRPDGAPTPDTGGPDGTFRREFDLPLGDLDSDAARSLA